MRFALNIFTPLAPARTRLAVALAAAGAGQGVKINKTSRLGWRVALAFQIGLHKKDLELLKRIKAYFGDTGTIVSFSDMCAFRVSSPEQIFKKILLHLALPRPGGQISFNKPETR